MSRCCCCRMARVLLLSVGLVLLTEVSAWAIFPPPIKDEGKFFSKEGLEKANKKIRDIYEKYKKDVVIETVDKLTPTQMKKFEDDPERFYPVFTLERSRELGLNGVYIFFVKATKKVQVHMDPETQKKAFTAANRKELLNAILAEFRDRNFDEGLMAGLKVIETAFRDNLAEPKPKPKTKD